MVQLSSALLPLAIAFLTVLNTPASALWPNPSKVETGKTFLTISSQFHITAPDNASDDLVRAIHRTEKHLMHDKLQRLVVGRGQADADAIGKAGQLAGLTITIGASGDKPADAAPAPAPPVGEPPADAPPADETCHVKTKRDGDAAASADNSIRAQVLLPVGQADESYKLTIPEDGKGATLEAANALGVLRGLTTLEQMFYVLPTNARKPYLTNAPVTIEDKPAFPYRGFMIDTSRNYLSVENIKQTIDAMSLVKLNNLQWHITDSQSFPLVVPGMENLAKNGAYADDMVYTAKDVSHVVNYAADRGINVILEVDMPGHMSTIGESHKEFVACKDTQPGWTAVANEPPSGQLTLDSPDVKKFTTKLIKAVTALFPGPVFSTGGDEVNSKCYGFEKGDEKLDQQVADFVKNAHEAVTASNKTAMVWEEMAIDFPETAKVLAKDTIVSVWTSSTNVAAVLKAREDLRVLHAPSDFFYLDCGLGGWLGKFPHGQSWCSFNTWQHAYSFDPLNGTADATNGAARVVGGQALLWAEQADEQNYHSLSWPRAAAPAEVFWTGANGPDGKPRDAGEALARLHDLRYRLVQRGIRAAPLQPLWCALRPNECDLPA